MRQFYGRTPREFFAVRNQLGNPHRRPSRSLEWSIAAIVARGREALRPAEVRGWSQIAQLIRDHAQYLTSRIDQEFPGPPAERRSELSVLFRAAEKAAEGADGLAGATRRSFELFYSGTHDDKERAEQAVQEDASFFFGACEWVQGCVERLDDREEFARSIAETAERHRAAAADLLRAARDVHAAAVAAAETLLAAAAPEPDDLERSTIGRRDASLRDIARADSFALAAEDEEDAVYRWLRRVPPAQRAFHEAVMDRGAEMNEATHTLWTQIHNDGVLELENALHGLQGDLHAQGGTPPPPANFADAIATNIAEGRVELAAAIQRLVDRIDRFQKLVIN